MTPSCRPVHLTLLLEPFRPANLAKKIAKCAQKWMVVQKKKKNNDKKLVHGVWFVEGWVDVGHF